MPGEVIKTLEKHRRFVVFVILLAAFRLFLMTSGHQFWPDEGHYLRAFEVLEQLGQGNPQEAVSILFESRGRPGFVIFAIVPAAIQKLSNSWGLSPVNPHYYDIPSFFNVLCTLGVTVLLYAILRRTLKNDTLALTGSIVYSLLVNTNVYLRHLLPYDISLFLFMLALWRVLRLMEHPPKNFHCAWQAGLLAALGFVSYPGYYLFTVIVFSALMGVTGREKGKALFLYSIPFVVVIGILELLSRWAGTSFIRESLVLSTDINQGSFSEGYVFWGRYLTVVEGWIGWVLGAGFFIFAFFVLPRSRGVMKAVFLVVIAGYLIHATMGVVFHKMVFYGRLMHMYFPFLVWGSIGALTLARRDLVRRVLLAGVLVCSGISFVSFGSTYAKLNYPKDFALRNLAVYPEPAIYRLSEHRPFHVDAAHQYPMVAVNVEFLYPITAYAFPLVPSPEQRLVVSAEHPINFPAHGFEGYTIEERERIAQRKYAMRVYARQMRP